MQATLSASVFMLLCTNAARAADRFDLQCDGYGQVTGSPALKTRPYHMHFGFDLVEKLFCIDDCEEALHIKSFDKQRITIDISQSDPTVTSGEINFDRVHGTMTLNSVFKAGMTLKATAQCKPSFFTGLVKPKF